MKLSQLDLQRLYDECETLKAKLRSDVVTPEYALSRFIEIQNIVISNSKPEKVKLELVK